MLLRLKQEVRKEGGPVGWVRMKNSKSENGKTVSFLLLPSLKKKQWIALSCYPLLLPV